MTHEDPEFALRLPFDYSDKQDAEDAREALLLDMESAAWWVDYLDGIEGTRAVSECLAECMKNLKTTSPFVGVIYALWELRSKAVNGAGDD